MADDTRGYKITPAASIGDYRKDGADRPVKLDAKMTANATAMGIKNPQMVVANYKSGGGSGTTASRNMSLNGTWGEIADPAKAIDMGFANYTRKENTQFGGAFELQPVGSPEGKTPAGFEGALMKCQYLKLINPNGDGSVEKGPKEARIPTCIWADYSTYGVVNTIDMFAAAAGQAPTLDQTAELAAQHYRDSRSKV
ncbi:hypothetical protein [Streptomyces somaliensis]|uniref:hypothetical protein n=1 Tax=Streptomyces somaliensis TaxID=78355 RepID=UPI0027E4335B|nr:hypothetical protein [Streptomyces somaliensis]